MLATRPCSLCRKYMFDEETGMPIFLGGKSEPAKRRGDVPCDTVLGCGKGHWKESPDLKKGEAFLMTMYKANRSSAGVFLNRRERSDSLVMEVFAALSDVDRMIDERNQKQSSMQLIEIVSAMQRSNNG